MPRLTQIKETKKGRLALFLDGEFAFSLDEGTFAAAALHQDDELEDWQIEELRKKSETRRALDKAMDYLSLRDHAAGELYQKLCRKFDAHSAAYAVARAGELGLLNDVSFARRRAAELLRKRKSRRAILDDLHAKGIDRGAAAEAVEALFAQSEEDEEENPELANARALVERHYAAKLAQGKWQQVAAALARRGFSHSVIRQALADAETEETEAENAQVKQSPEEMRQKELKEVIEQYNREKQDPDYYYLPDQWDGQKLIWQKSGDRTGSLLASLAFFAAFVVMLKKAKEQQEEMAKRAEQLLMDYPSLIMKFTLLIQAGMTARKVFQKMYEAIIIMCHEMDSGIAELEAYRRFGERCGQMKYKTFSTILIQNLQKGSHRMADLLEKEALEAWDERKRKARVLGETAATKLLVPMVMMLAVVMAIIMIPAFLSFYG